MNASGPWREFLNKQLQVFLCVTFVETVRRVTGLRELHPAIETERLDVTDAAAIDTLYDRLNGIDVLVNAVGIVHNGSILECTEADWAAAVSLNLTSMVRIIRAGLPDMISRRGGSIINGMNRHDLIVDRVIVPERQDMSWPKARDR